jgi:hypothetical protein
LGLGNNLIHTQSKVRSIKRGISAAHEKLPRNESESPLSLAVGEFLAIYFDNEKRMQDFSDYQSILLKTHNWKWPLSDFDRREQLMELQTHIREVTERDAALVAAHNLIMSKYGLS